MKDRKPLSGTYETSTFREMIFFESQVRELEAYTSKLEKELEEMTSSCLENLAQKLQYRNIIEDLKNISPDHASYLKVLSEKDQMIENMKCCGNCAFDDPHLKLNECFGCKRGYEGVVIDNWQMKESTT